MRQLKIITLFILLSIASKAQEMWGISNSNFAGNMGIFLNPTTIVDAPYQYEINLVALDLFNENTFLYYPINTKIVRRALVGNQGDGTVKYTPGMPLQSDFSHTLIIGPSYIRNKTKFAWGIHSAFRSEASVLKISPEMALLLIDNFNSPQLAGTRYSTVPFSSAYASWFEVGGTYGKIFRENEKQIFKWAANGNLLIGQNGYYYDGHAFDFTSVDSSQLIVHKMDASLAHAASPDNSTFFGLRGLGLSATLGVTYIKNPNRGAFDCNMSNDQQKKYKYRLGFSLLDLGMIHYFGDAQIYNVNANSNYVWNGIDTIKGGSFGAIDSTLLTHVGGTLENKSFNIFLPLALSVQFDYQLRANLFANASFVNRLHFLKNEIARGNQVNASLRYERRRYEAALNFTLFEYKQPSMGLGLRYRFFVIGTDRLLQMLGLTNAYSSDIFFGLKFQFCKKPFSKGKDCPAYSAL